MRKHVRRRYDAQVRASNVCHEHSGIFDITPGGQKARTALAARVTDVGRLFALQERTLEDQRAATEQIRIGRRALRDRANVVVKIGKLVRVDETTMTTMQLPGSVSDDELVAYLRGLIDRVAPHADAFIAEGMPPDLLTNLQDGIQQFAAAKDRYAAARQGFTAATEMIRETQAKVDNTIDALEAIAVITPAAHPEMLTKLRMAKRVGPRAAASAKSVPLSATAPEQAETARTPTDNAGEPSVMRLVSSVANRYWH